MIIHSLLDTDLYKFTMMQVVLHQFPGAQVEYKFKCRNPGVQLAPYVDEIREEIRHLCTLRFSEEELDYLRTLRFIKSDFVDFLGLFKLNEKQAIDVKGLKVLAAKLEGVDAKTLRDTLDKLKDKLKTAAIVLAAVDGDKVQLAAGVTKDAVGQVKAGELVNFVAQQVGGKGGGKPDMAMAGGTNAAALPQALQSVQGWVAAKLACEPARIVGVKSAASDAACGVATHPDPLFRPSRSNHEQVLKASARGGQARAARERPEREAKRKSPKGAKTMSKGRRRLGLCGITIGTPCACNGSISY